MAPPQYRRHVQVNARGQRVLLALAAVALVAFVLGASSGASSGASGPAGLITLVGPIRPSADQRLERARQQVMSYTDYISNGTPNSNEVALTFDDGPSTFTPQILKVLNETNTPATFFEVGNNIQEFPLAAQAVAVGGFPIGDHTYDHKDLKTLDPAGQAAELNGMANAITKLGVPRPTLFRPPYGSYNQATLSLLSQRKMLMVLWSVDSEDWQRPGVDTIVQNVLGKISAGDIVLMHDGGGDRSQTVAALPQIIKGIRAKGLKPVTVAQLVADDPPPRTQTQPSLASAG